MYPLDYNSRRSNTNAFVTPEDGIQTGAPSISQSPQEFKPVHDRLYENAKEKWRRLSSENTNNYEFVATVDKKLLQAQPEMQYPFKPQISLKSAQIVENLRRIGKYTDGIVGVNQHQQQYSIMPAQISIRKQSYISLNNASNMDNLYSGFNEKLYQSNDGSQSQRQNSNTKQKRKSSNFNKRKWSPSVRPGNQPNCGYGSPLLQKRNNNGTAQQRQLRKNSNLNFKIIPDQAEIEAKRKLNEQLVERMTQRQIIEAIAYSKSQRQGSTIQQANRDNPVRIGYDIFFDVFYYLGTFSEPFSRTHYQQLNIRERHFAEGLWSLLQNCSKQGSPQFFSLDDQHFIQVLLSFYSSSKIIKDDVISSLQQCLQISESARASNDLQTIVNQFHALNQEKFGKIVNYRLKVLLKMQRHLSQELLHHGPYKSGQFGSAAYSPPKAAYEQQQECTFTQKTSQALTQRKMSSPQSTLRSEFVNQSFKPNNNVKLVKQVPTTKVINQPIYHTQKSQQPNSGARSAREQQARIKRLSSPKKLHQVQHQQNLIKNSSPSKIYNKLGHNLPMQKNGNVVIGQNMSNQKELYKPILRGKRKNSQIQAQRLQIIDILNQDIEADYDQPTTIANHHQQQLTDEQQWQLRVAPHSPTPPPVLSNHNTLTTIQDSPNPSLVLQQCQNITQAFNTAADQPYHEMPTEDNPEENNLDQEEGGDNLFILSMTLSNNKTYLVEVKKNCDARVIAERFCRENGMQNDMVIKQELEQLLRQYIKSYQEQVGSIDKFQIQECDEENPFK